MTTNTEGTVPPVIPEGHTMTKRQLLQWLDNVGMDDPITVYNAQGWWLNLVGVDANPENLTVILETRDDFDITHLQWERSEKLEENTIYRVLVSPTEMFYVAVPDEVTTNISGIKTIETYSLKRAREYAPDAPEGITILDFEKYKTLRDNS